MRAQTKPGNPGTGTHVCRRRYLSSLSNIVRYWKKRGGLTNRKSTGELSLFTKESIHLVTNRNNAYRSYHRDTKQNITQIAQTATAGRLESML